MWDLGNQTQSSGRPAMLLTAEIFSNAPHMAFYMSAEDMNTDSQDYRIHTLPIKPPLQP